MAAKDTSQPRRRQPKNSSLDGAFTSLRAYNTRLGLSFKALAQKISQNNPQAPSQLPSTVASRLVFQPRRYSAAPRALIPTGLDFITINSSQVVLSLTVFASTRLYEMDTTLLLLVGLNR